MKTIFSQKIRELRREAGLSQEQLAAECGISVQAVSKWECAQSYPDIELLVMLAQRFDTTVDALLREDAPPRTDAPREEMRVVLTTLPDDDCLRVVQCVGQRVVSREEFDPERKIPLLLENTKKRTVNVEIWGSAEIDGDVSGDAAAGGGINCGNVGGDAAAAGGGINCGNVGGDAAAMGGGINCGNVGGDAAAAGGGINCGNVGGDATATGEMHCGDVKGDVSTQKDIHCRVIHGDVECDGNIIYEKC